MDYSLVLQQLYHGQSTDEDFTFGGNRPAIDTIRTLISVDQLPWLTDLLNDHRPGARYFAVNAARFICTGDFIRKVKALEPSEPEFFVRQAMIFALIHWGSSHEEMERYLKVLRMHPDEHRDAVTGFQSSTSVDTILGRISDPRYDRVVPVYIQYLSLFHPGDDDAIHLLVKLRDHCNPHVRELANAYLD